MQEQTYRRVDVGVTLKVSPEGNVRPLTITFENGKTYTIDRLKERKRAAATKVGGTGIRYTVVIQNREDRFLWTSSFPGFRTDSDFYLFFRPCAFHSS